MAGDPSGHGCFIAAGDGDMTTLPDPFLPCPAKRACGGRSSASVLPHLPEAPLARLMLPGGEHQVVWRSPGTSKKCRAAPLVPGTKLRPVRGGEGDGDADEPAREANSPAHPPEQAINMPTRGVCMYIIWARPSTGRPRLQHAVSAPTRPAAADAALSLDVPSRH